MPGIETSPPGAISPATCSECPLTRAAAIREAQGVEAEAHFLRVQVSELSHKLALVRAYARRQGLDPDIAYQPHEAEDPAREHA